MSYINHIKDLYKTVHKSLIPRKHSEKENPFTFVPMSNVILRSDTAVLKETGEVLKLTSDFKIAYTYMRERYSYSEAAGNTYYESWESVATILGKNKAVFKNKGKGELALHEQMMLLGLLVIDGTKTGRSNNKVVLDVSDVLDKVSFVNSADEDLQVRRKEIKDSYADGKKKEEEAQAKLEAERVVSVYTPPEPAPFESSYEDQWEDDLPF